MTAKDTQLELIRKFYSDEGPNTVRIASCKTLTINDDGFFVQVQRDLFCPPDWSRGYDVSFTPRRSQVRSLYQVATFANSKRKSSFAPHEHVVYRVDLCEHEARIDVDFGKDDLVRKGECQVQVQVQVEVEVRSTSTT